MQKESIVGIQGSNGFVGCGFAVTSRHILTCAHVVNAAFSPTKTVSDRFPDEIISVCFPFLGNKTVPAKVVYWKPDIHNIRQLPSVNQGIEEDIAGLELLEVVSGVQPVQVKPYCENIEFKSLGYPKKTPQGAVAQGTIQAAIPFGWVQIDGNSPEGFWVAPGYSGTPIWDVQNGEDVYGMMVAVRTEDEMAHRIAYMIPYEGLTRSIEFLKLLNHLPQPEQQEDQDEVWQAYCTVYEQCKPPDWNPELPIPQTPGALLAQINDMGQSELSGSEKHVVRLWEFVARFLIQAHFLAESQKQLLREWGIQQYSDFLQLIDQIQNLLNQNQTEPQAIVDPCLMVEVSPNHPPYSTRAFFIPDAHTYDANNHETWKEVFCWDFQNRREGIQELRLMDDTNLESELKARLSGYIKTCQRKYQPDRQFRLELILPLSLMNQPIECQELDSSAYETIIPASTFPVVIRSYDRTTEEYQEDLGEQWKARWRCLQTHLNSGAHECLADVALKVKAAQLTAAYRANPKTVGFKLAEVFQTSSQERFVGALLGAAVPVALWLRHLPSSLLNSDENSAQTHLQGFLQGSVGTLLDRILDVRAEAIATSIEADDENFKVGHHLSLLWENPHLVPPVAPKQVSE